MCDVLWRLTSVWIAAEFSQICLNVSLNVRINPNLTHEAFVLAFFHSAFLKHNKTYRALKPTCDESNRPTPECWGNVRLLKPSKHLMKRHRQDMHSFPDHSPSFRGLKITCFPSPLIELLYTPYLCSHHSHNSVTLLLYGFGNAINSLKLWHMYIPAVFERSVRCLSAGRCEHLSAFPVWAL